MSSHSKASNLNTFLTTLREVTHSPNPSPQQRLQVFYGLRKHREHRDVWQPFLDAPPWNHTPLVSCTLPNMTGGSSNGPCVPLGEYIATLPDGPIELDLQGKRDWDGSDIHARSVMSTLEPYQDALKRCRSIIIDRPEASLDDGQNGGFSSSANINKLISVLGLVYPLLPNVTRLTLRSFSRPHFHGWGELGDNEPKIPKSHAKINAYSMDHFRELLEVWSITELRWSIHQSPHNFAFLKNMSFWKGLEKLDLGNNHIQPKHIKRIFKPALPNLTHLRLTSCKDLDNEAIQELKEILEAPEIVEIDLRGTNVSQDCAESLCTSSKFPKLNTVRTGTF